MNNKLILGTAQFGMNYGIANKNNIPNKNKIYEILNYAYLNNISSIDTASGYGNSENIIGNYLKEHANQNWNIITKNDNPKIALLDQIKDSKKKLNCTPNIFMSHSSQMFLSDRFQNEAINLKKKLPIKIGVSLYNDKEINSVLNMPFLPEVIQLPISALDTRLLKNDSLGKIKMHKIEIHARSIFLQGLFFMPELYIKKHFNDAFYSLKMLEEISLKEGLSVSDLSLLWVNSLQEIDKIIVGTEALSQLKSNISTLEKKCNKSAFNDLLNIKYENQEILNPQNWKL